MAIVPARDAGAMSGLVFAFANNATEGTVATGSPELLTAGGNGDNAKIVGNTINRQTYGMPASCVVNVSAYFNLADTETLSLALEIQESSDGSSWDTAVAIEAATVVYTSSGGETEGVVRSYKIKLSDRKQYVRFNCTPNLSASSTDICTVHGTVSLYGPWNNSLLPDHGDDDE